MKICEVHNRMACYCHSPESTVSDADNCRTFSTFSRSQEMEEVDTRQSSSCESLHREHFSTPEKKCNTTAYNPFDTRIESLSFPALSPSVFLKSGQLEEDDKVPFSWSIDQMAILAPADIDETSHQDTYQELDVELEQKAQNAIEHFFSHNSIVPSPWGMTAKQMTFSPKIASSACYSKSNPLSNSSEPKQQVKEVWTQTVLSIPPGVDILDRLGEFCAFHMDQYQQKHGEENESYDANASLRRKLFAMDRNSTTPRSYRNVVRPTAETKTPSSPLWPWTAQLSPRWPLKTPEWPLKTPEKQTTLFAMPGSAQFSSSPISGNCSTSSDIPLQQLISPPLSPISKSEVKTPSTGNAKSLHKQNRNLPYNSSPIACSLSNICMYAQSENAKKSPPSHGKEATPDHDANFVSAFDVSLSMLSDGECTQEMRSKTGPDISETLPKQSFLPVTSQDVGYVSNQGTGSHELLSVVSTNIDGCERLVEEESGGYYFGSSKSVRRVGAWDSQMETSSMDVDLRHSLQIEDRTSVGTSTQWKPSVYSTPHL